MSLWKCNSCGGVYQDVQADGLVYMHACAPGKPNAQGVQEELANKRDENVALDRRQNPRGIVSEGAGITPMEGQPETEPHWIARMRAHIALLDSQIK